MFACIGFPSKCKHLFTVILLDGRNDRAAMLRHKFESGLRLSHHLCGLTGCNARGAASSQLFEGLDCLRNTHAIDPSDAWIVIRPPRQLRTKVLHDIHYSNFP
jgi:hypothetical protein